ncbi:hypothetical protein RRG08_029883 [Elysia crispata]|uniref:Uncharacterized protein n=1 Tax=Elysia crispata TaxID=231223 RepID=A0AAE0YKJ8_9GAST|nr:hypothetical protein RRG08_029883 [Elysia crispata]
MKPNNAGTSRKTEAQSELQILYACFCREMDEQSTYSITVVVIVEVEASAGTKEIDIYLDVGLTGSYRMKSLDLGKSAVPLATNSCCSQSTKTETSEVQTSLLT